MSFWTSPGTMMVLYLVPPSTGVEQPEPLPLSWIVLFMQISTKRKSLLPETRRCGSVSTAGWHHCFLGSAEQIFWTDADAHHYLSLLEYGSRYRAGGGPAGPGRYADHACSGPQHGVLSEMQGGRSEPTVWSFPFRSHFNLPTSSAGKERSPWKTSFTNILPRSILERGRPDSTSPTFCPPMVLMFCWLRRRLHQEEWCLRRDCRYFEGERQDGH